MEPTLGLRTAVDRKSPLLFLPGELRVRPICFIDSERYFAYGTSYDRGTNHASVQFLLLIWCWLATCVRLACALVVFVLYSESFRHRFVIIRLLSSKIHIRYSYENFNSFFSVISIELIGNDLFRIIHTHSLYVHIRYTRPHIIGI